MKNITYDEFLAFTIGILLGAAVTCGINSYLKSKEDLKIGMKVTNGYCVGFLTDINGNQATMLQAHCKDADNTYNLYADRVVINKNELKEVK